MPVLAIITPGARKCFASSGSLARVPATHSSVMRHRPQKCVISTEIVLAESCVKGFLCEVQLAEAVVADRAQAESVMFLIISRNAFLRCNNTDSLVQ
jgi:hypothetical protein